MTAKACVRIRKLNIPAATFFQVFNGWRMANKAIAVITIDSMLLIRLMTGFTGFITRRHRGIRLNRFLYWNLGLNLARQSQQAQCRQ
jgi:hypothetical protein